ncbi:hypothetical protein M2137_001501 [Parabacteroides sp. PFB2-10]|uniref:hypothetical protein n=1 Tax=Parabacteroides sp. PFB2-10 TaxID=1742405 RepID=UPI002473023B|nr:hypothetical protein [Parabacteroides sp. PFB2-10]MDH6312726.1 hypothetical protein [Parabacteroides sp. PFB2-10]
MKQTYNTNDKTDKQDNLHEPASVYQTEEPLVEETASLKPIKEPDDDFYRAINMEDFAIGAKKHIRELYKQDKK